MIASCACPAAIFILFDVFNDQEISIMCEGHEPSFLVRFGDFKRLRNRQKGIPEPPNILLVVDFSNYVSAEEFGDPDFDEDLMLNQIQLMSLHGQDSLLLQGCPECWFYIVLKIAFHSTWFYMILSFSNNKTSTLDQC